MKKYKRKKRNSKVYTYLLFFIFIIIAFVCFTHSSLFDVQNVYVEGADVVSASEVLELSGIKKGENIFSFKASSAEKNIKTLPMVKNVSVVRIYPNNVKIVITERIAAMAYSVDKVNYACDSVGYNYKIHQLFKGGNIEKQGVKMYPHQKDKPKIIRKNKKFAKGNLRVKIRFHGVIIK